MGNVLTRKTTESAPAADQPAAEASSAESVQERRSEIPVSTNKLPETKTAPTEKAPGMRKQIDAPLK